MRMGRVYRETSRPWSSSSSSSPQVMTSTSITETVNGSYHFNITGHSLSKGIGVGKYIASDTFMVGGHAWAIYFYPNGKSVEDNATYVLLFIVLASEGTDVRALFELTLLDQSGKERYKVHNHFGRALESGPYTLKYRGNMCRLYQIYARQWNLLALLKLKHQFYRFLDIKADVTTLAKFVYTQVAVSEGYQLLIKSMASAS